MADRLKLKVIACGVFEQELQAVAGACPNTVDVELLDAGLHARPDELRLRAQEAIDSASRDGYDAICCAYGLCGRGTVGLVTHGVPLVIPRVHDCISLFLGSASAYRKQFAHCPGTFYFTPGWFRHKAHPERTRIAAARRFDPTTHRHYDEFRDRYGEDNARYIVEFLESWRRNYQRAALIDHGFVEREHEELTRAIAGAAGWRYERLEGSLALLKGLVAGAWDEDAYLVVPPEHMVVPTNDERIFGAVPAPQGETVSDWSTRMETAVRSESYLVAGDAPAGAPPPEVGLGIDAGGTYTDAALYDLAGGRILSTGKALTTHHDLVEGIVAALSQLEQSLFGRVDYVCLSTTLATNAIVEGRGRMVGLLLMPYHPEAADRIKTPLLRCLRARTNIEGVEERPVDGEEVVRAARELLREGASAFAVSGYAAVRNPRHEVRVREILLEEFELPVVCGHELSPKLDFVARAHTAVLNARLVPLVDELLDAVEDVLAEVGLRVPLFVVRGDGSIMRREMARLRPVETILSGPAASAAGGAYLTGTTDGLVVDMGGTTTDIAALRDGRPLLSAEGAQVGTWRTSVAAADVQTTGLGGDSVVRPAGERRVQVGPERVIPLCMLAERYPAVLEDLERLSGGTEEGAFQRGEFLVLHRANADVALSRRERQIVDLLAERPLSRAALSRACGCAAPELLPVGRLEQTGIVRRSSVTPTDALHVLGTFTAFDVAAAGLGMRALGGALGVGEAEAARLVQEETERLLALALMRRELSLDGPLASRGHLGEVRSLLERALRGGEGAPFHLRWQQSRPVVGIGAPIAAFLPGACRRLDTRPLIPPHAEVANAVGAAVSKVAVRAELRIRPSQVGGYVLYAPDCRREFARLSRAIEGARRHVVELVRRRASRFGTHEREVHVAVEPRTGRLRDGSSQLVEVVVAGTLEGMPASG